MEVLGDPSLLGLYKNDELKLGKIEKSLVKSIINIDHIIGLSISFMNNNNGRILNIGPEMYFTPKNWGKSTNVDSSERSF